MAPKKFLFVCGHNLRRSLTAERICNEIKGYEARSAGTRREARVSLSEELILWADIIFVMEHEHLETLRKHFKPALKGKRVICLQIPDTYGYMNPGLIKVLKEKLGMYITMPR
jgi:predicted protein tyrosine phosphatase